MTFYRLVLEPRGSIKVGGYSATHRSGSMTARDARSLLVPSSAIKGALRESAARLVRSTGGTVRSHKDSLPPEPGASDIIGRLFGRFDIHPGKLRLGPLRVNGEGTLEPLAVRHHVTLERATRQAAHGRLFDMEVSPPGLGLRFEGLIEALEPLDDNEEGLLRTAVTLTDQIGAGRGQGLGMVALSLHGPVESAEDESAGVSDPEALSKAIAGGSIVLCLMPEEPLQLGAAKNASNLQRCDAEIAGSVSRGAVANVLARISPKNEREAILEAVFGGSNPAVFGVARVGNSAIPAPNTLSMPKGKGPPIDRALDLALEGLGCASHPLPADYRTAKGTWSKTEEGWAEVKIPRRLITRAARDPVDGRASAGQLYSIETLDANFETEPQRLVFQLPVDGTHEQLEHILKVTPHGLVAGGSRGRGLGHMRVVGVHQRKKEAVTERHRAWAEALVACSAVPGKLDNDDALATGCLLALGFLAVSQRRLREFLRVFNLKLFSGEARRHHLGGWNTRSNLPRTAVGGFAMGSVFLVRTPDGSSAASALESAERHGIGPGRTDGWGRVVACHPIHLETHAHHPRTAAWVDGSSTDPKEE